MGKSGEKKRNKCVGKSSVNGGLLLGFEGGNPTQGFSSHVRLPECRSWSLLSLGMQHAQCIKYREGYVEVHVCFFGIWRVIIFPKTFCFVLGWNAGR